MERPTSAPPYVAYCSLTKSTECYIGCTIPVMPADAKLSHTAAMILQAIHAGQIYGFSVMQMTGLPSGTVYPAMRRLERDGLIVSKWEQQSIADAEQRPPAQVLPAHARRQVHAGGRLQALSAARENDPFARGGT